MDEFINTSTWLDDAMEVVETSIHYEDDNKSEERKEPLTSTPIRLNEIQWNDIQIIQTRPKESFLTYTTPVAASITSFPNAAPVHVYLKQDTLTAG